VHVQKVYLSFIIILQKIIHLVTQLKLYFGTHLLNRMIVSSQMKRLIHFVAVSLYHKLCKSSFISPWFLFLLVVDLRQMKTNAVLPTAGISHFFYPGRNIDNWGISFH
jgi:hypothetical protein